MALILVTGLFGSGKSAVYRELIRRGHEAYGFDEDGFGEWIDTSTGRVVPFPTERSEGDTVDLEFVVHHDKLAALAEATSARVAYLCGGAGHEFRFWDLLAEVVYLNVDDDTLASRLTSRTDNGYGKAPAELSGILEANGIWANTYRARGAVVLDATRPLVAIVDDVVAIGGHRRF